MKASSLLDSTRRRLVAATLLGAASIAVLAVLLLPGQAQSAAEARLAVLNGPTVGLPSSFGSSNSAEETGVDPSAVHLADTSTTDKVWLAAKDSTVCLYVSVEAPRASTACGLLDDAVAGKIAMTISGRTSTTVVGVIPDGTDSVDLTTSQGVTKVPVTDNVFVAHSAASLESVSFTDSAGPHSLRLANPN